MATAFDTLSTYESITAAGIDDKAARAISKAIADSIATYRADLTTKADLAQLKAELRAEIAEVRAELRAEIAAVKELIASTHNKTIIWTFGMLVTFSGVIIAAQKLL